MISQRLHAINRIEGGFQRNLHLLATRTNISPLPSNPLNIRSIIHRSTVRYYRPSANENEEKERKKEKEEEEEEEEASESLQLPG